MIQLTRLNNQPLMVNCDLIKFVERAPPGTLLTRVTGEKVIVRETWDEVTQKITSFRRSIVSGLGTEKASEAAANPPRFGRRNSTKAGTKRWRRRSAITP